MIRVKWDVIGGEKRGIAVAFVELHGETQAVVVQYMGAPMVVVPVRILKFDGWVDA